MKTSNTNTKPPAPLEDEEQQAVVEWCEGQGLRLTAIPNNTYTKSWNQKRKNQRTGLRAGLPDLLILVAPHQSKDGIGRALFLEMKRVKPYDSAVSPGQRAWIAALNGLQSPTVDSVVAHGAQEAIEYVSGFLRRVDSNPF